MAKYSITIMCDPIDFSDKTKHIPLEIHLQEYPRTTAIEFRNKLVSVEEAQKILNLLNGLIEHEN